MENLNVGGHLAGANGSIIIILKSFLRLLNIEVVTAVPNHIYVLHINFNDEVLNHVG